MSERIYQISTSSEQFLKDVAAEYDRAVKKFPNPNQQMTAVLLEEVGEVARAALDYERGDEGATASHVYTECVQAAAMCLRFALKGSIEFPDYQQALRVVKANTESADAL